MTNNILKTGVLAVLFVCAATANAQQQGRGMQNKNTSYGSPNPDQIIAKLDTNFDGKIDKMEASQAQRGRLAESFNELDINNDGYIDKEELANMGARKSTKKPNKPSPEEIFAIVDYNKDGLLDDFEVAAKDKGNLQENFRKIDTDTDGYISMEELKAFQELEKPKKHKKKRNKKN